MLGVPWPLLGALGKGQNRLGGRGSDASAPLPPHSQHRAAQAQHFSGIAGAESNTALIHTPKQAGILDQGLGEVLTICPVQGNWPGTGNP